MSTFWEQASATARLGIRVSSASTSKNLKSKSFELPVTRQDGTQEGWDVGLLVVCRKPLDAANSVTTVILAGHSMMASKDMADDLGRGIPYIDKLEDGKPVSRLLITHWKKRGSIPKRQSVGRHWIDLFDNEAVEKSARFLAERVLPHKRAK